MTILEYIKTILLALVFLGAILGAGPYLIILFGTITIVPYLFLCKGILKRINNQDNKTVKIAGYLSMITPIIIVSLTTYSTKISISEDVFLLSLLILPNLALVECICLYLCFYDLRNNRTVISDIKNGTKLIKTHHKPIIIAIILIIALLLGKYASNNYYSLVSDEFPIKEEYCKVYFPIEEAIIFSKNNTITKSSLDDEEYESTDYNYIYNKRTKKIKYYMDNKLIKTGKLLYYDDKIYIIEKKYVMDNKNHKKYIEISGCNNNSDSILDQYKKESSLNVSGYYLDEDNEYYLTQDKKIFIGTKDGIKKGTYEVLEFKLDYLSDPVINYTLDGQEKEGNTGGIDYYNDTSLYIKDKNNIEINNCSKYGYHCFRRNKDDYFKKVNKEQLNYLKNIQ